MDKKELKEKVRSKLNLAEDIKQNKISKSIYEVKLVDGKIQARFELSGIPPKKSSKSDFIESGFKSFTKIFDNIEDFSEYAIEFFNADPEEIVQEIQED